MGRNDVTLYDEKLSPSPMAPLRDPRLFHACTSFKKGNDWVHNHIHVQGVPKPKNRWICV